MELKDSDYSTLEHDDGTARIAGDLIVVNSLVLMALNDYDADEEGPYVYKCRKATVTKVGAQAWAAGDKIYYDTSAGNFTTTSTDNTLAGRAIKDAASADTEGDIELNPDV